MLTRFTKGLSRSATPFRRAALSTTSAEKSRRVLLCIEGNESSNINSWSDFLQHDDQIHLLNVYQPVPQSVLANLPSKEQRFKDEVKGLYHRAAEQRASEVAAVFQQSGFPNAKAVTQEGKDAAEVICDYASSSNADVVLIGKKGDMLSSITTNVVRNCSQPVYVCPARDVKAEQFKYQRPKDFKMNTKKSKVRFHL
mmetsp:Transcript_6278/g.10411  ORF Transcript_6278/g.10411 Transcript_6278/m.10411 type:complete len:197 (+) Transcript_6278:186-776(+)|eukprot:jgi/Bigna1/62565/fgenesh1_kg.37_\